MDPEITGEEQLMWLKVGGIRVLLNLYHITAIVIFV